MIKLTFCLRRLPHLTVEEFQEYWLNNHAPLAARHAETLNIRRYIQTHTLATPINDLFAKSRNAPEPYDGVAELWFDSLESMAAGGATPEGRTAAKELLEDERKFIDHGRSPLWLSEQHPIVGD